MLELLRVSLRFCLLTLFFLLIVVALLTGLLRLGLPYMSSYKGEIQTWVSDYLKTPVDIGSMDFAWNGSRPSLTLDNVALQPNSSQLVGVKLDKIQLDLNLLKSLMRAELHINEVTLSGADLALEYDSGEFKISSSQFTEGSPAKAADTGLDVVAWLMNASRVALLNSRIKLLDKERDIDYLVTDLNIRAENTGDFHQLRLDLSLPDQLGKSLEVGIDFTGNSDALSESAGNFYLKSDAMNLANWLAVWPQRSIDVAGAGNVELWGSWSKQFLQALRAKVDGRDLGLSGRQQVSGGDSSALVSRRFATDIFWARQDTGWSADISRMEFEHKGAQNKVDQLSLSRAKNSTTGHREFSITGKGDQLQLSVLADLSSVLSGFNSRSASEILNKTSPSGTVQDWEISASFNPDDVSVHLLRGEFENISIVAHQRIPGVNNLSGRASIVEDTGMLEINSSDLILQSLSVFPEPVHIENVEASFQIDFNDSSNLVRSKKMILKDGAALAYVNVGLLRAADSELVVDLTSAFSLDDVTTASRYFPRGKMRDSLEKWLEKSVRGGKVENGSALLYGKLKDFPYSNGKGIFQVDIDIADGELKFLPSWPAAKKVSGNLHFEGAGMSFNASGGTLAGNAVTGVKGGIENFWRPTLTVKGNSTGKLQKMLEFANTGPLKNILKPALGDTLGSGSAALAFEVSLPLMSYKRRTAEDVLRVDGSVALANNNVVFNRFNLGLRQASGRIDFDEKGVSIKKLNASYLGSPVDLTAKTVGKADKTKTILRVDGKVRPNEVLETYKLPVASFFKGASKWNVEVTIPHSSKRGSGVNIRASSDLVGTSVLLPTPVAKEASAPRRVAVVGDYTHSGLASWRVIYDGFKTVIKTEPKKGMHAMAVRLGNGTLPKKLKPGIRIDALVDELSFDGWISAVADIIEQLPESSGDREPMMPVTGKISTRRMMVGTELMGPATYTLNTDEKYLNAVVENQHLRGNVRYPRIHWLKSNAAISRVAYVDHVFLEALKTGGNQNKPAVPLDPRKFPRMEIQVAQFQWKAMTLKDLVMRTEPDVAGMNITALGFANDNARMSGSGYWHLADPQSVNPALTNQHRTSVDLNLKAGNVGQMLSAAGLKNVMAEGKGTVVSSLRWQGPGYDIDVANMIGGLQLDLQEGRFLKVDPGAGRLVGLFAFQELPRRLSLDFRDLVHDGLDYHTIKGNLDLAGGVARIGNLRLEGPVGIIEVTGSTHMVKHSFDQSITVLPRISAAVPIIALLSGGATAGVGALVATPVLKALGIDLDRIGLTEYTLKGSWSKPELDRVSLPTHSGFPEDDK